MRMMEKEPDSMATVQMKPEYAASEVYSTTSEPPPAYKRKSNAVQIAKIVAFTFIVSSFVIGSFILAGAFIQARASCDQMNALDSVLEKELMLETLQQVNKEIPRAEALIGKQNDELDLQNLEKELKTDEIKEGNAVEVDENDSNVENDSNGAENEENDDLQKVNVKVPLDFDLSDLAAALLANNQKSRMNCVVERKHAEEFVDTPAKNMQLPFGLNLSTEPKKSKVTGERIAIFCESGSEVAKRMNEDAEQIRPVFIPIQRFPIPFGPTPQEIPLTHMPQRMPPQQMFQNIPPPFQQLPMRPPTPPQVMQAPRVEPQVRIQVQRIPMRELQISQDLEQAFPGAVADNSLVRPSMPQIQVQRVPLGVALERAGITQEDLRNIQRMAEERITEELRHLATEEAASQSVDSSDSSEEDDRQSQSVQQQHEQEQILQGQLPPQPQQMLHPPMPEPPQILQIGRAAYGRSLPNPVRIPVPMMHPQEMIQERTDSERPHYVQPRSVRSVDDTFLHRDKRVKRCACNCDC